MQTQKTRFHASQPCLELDTREVAAGICGDTLGNKSGDPRVNTTRQALRYRIRCLDLERAFSIKGENLGGDGVAM